MFEIYPPAVKVRELLVLPAYKVVLELQERDVSLKQWNRELMYRFNIKRKMHFDGSVYWNKEAGERSAPEGLVTQGGTLWYGNR